MKFKVDRPMLVKIGCVLLLLAVAPFAIEFLFIADFVGVEFAVTFMLLYFKTAFFELVEKWWRFKTDFKNQIYSISQLAMFQPRMYGVTSTATCLVVVLTGTTLAACTLWIPALIMSSGHLA